MRTVGQRLGELDLVELIGKGGMGQVYLGRSASGETRAIKVIRSETGEWSAMRSFVDEAMLAVRIRHANVVRTYELGEHDDTFFLVMEYVPGCSLAKLLQALSRNERALDPALAAWIACEVAAGLEAVHGLTNPDGEHLGVVHRDVSPQNVLLGLGGSVKLTDFGIAKASGRAERTRTGIIKGKLRYMAPEQALARPVDARTDVYALGLVLWQMLTMRRPFEELAKARLLRAVQRGGLKPPSWYVEGIPPAIDDAVRAALEPDPSDRPASMADFAALLKDACPSGGEAASALTTLLFEFTRDEMKTASRRIGEEPTAPLESSDATAPATPKAKVEDAAAWTREVEGGGLKDEEWSGTPLTSTEIPIPGSRSRRTAIIAVVSFVLGIAVTIGLMLALR